MEAPENTLPAYIKAWEQGVDAVELDVRETKDKRLVCIHDDSLARVSESEYTISQETLAALKTVDVGSSRSKKFANTYIPLLKEAFDCKPAYNQTLLLVKVCMYLQTFLNESCLRLQFLKQQEFLARLYIRFH